MESELVTIYSVYVPVEAEVIKTCLEANGIKCFLEDQHGGGFGTGQAIRISVHKADAENAIKLITELSKGSQKDIPKRKPLTFIQWVFLLLPVWILILVGLMYLIKKLWPHLLP